MDDVQADNTCKTGAGMKRVLLDSSSLILLQKADLLSVFSEFCRLYLTPAVYEEVTVAGKTGVEMFENLCQGGLLHVLPLPETKTDLHVTVELEKMGRGELQTLLHAITGDYDCIVVDDRQAAKFCYKWNIPFINGLLVPKILFWAGHISGEESHRYFGDIERRGHYSKTIILRAKQLSQDELQQFIP